MFLNILEFTVENKKNIFRKLCWKCGHKFHHPIAYMSTKLLLEKVQKLKKNKNKKPWKRLQSLEDSGDTTSSSGRFLRPHLQNNIFCFLLLTWKFLETCINCVTKWTTAVSLYLYYDKRRDVQWNIAWGSFSIRMDNSCKNGGKFLFCKLHMFLNLMEPRVKNKKIKFRKNGFANMVSDKKKLPYWP